MAKLSQGIEKSRNAAVNAGKSMTDHFVEVNKMVELGSGMRREYILPKALAFLPYIEKSV